MVAVSVETLDAIQVLFFALTLPLALVTGLLVSEEMSGEWAGWAYAVALGVGVLFTAGAAKAAGPLPEILQPQNDVSLVAAIGYIYVSAYGLAALLMAAVGLSAGALIGYYRRPRVS